MNFNEARLSVEERLSKKRFVHTLGVVEAARSLSALYGVNEEQAIWAALLHDVGKEMSLEDMQTIVDEEGLQLDSQVYTNGALLHGEVGAIIASKEFGITDEHVIEAIRVHTTGKPNMSTLDKVIFLADYIEPNRVFLGVEQLRELATQNLDLAVLEGYDSTIRYLLDQKLSIYTMTLLGRNDIIASLRR